MDLIITEHAKERYAERIMNKDSKTDIATYIAKHEEDIKVGIEKMIEYGELLYTGASLSQYNKEVVNVYLRDTWVVIVDVKRNKVVTLYTIDLGLGKEFNDLYIKRLLEQLEVAKSAYAECEQDIAASKSQHEDMIEENEDVIADCRRTAKSLEKQNEIYREMIQSLDTNLKLKENDVRNVVARLVGRKVF